MPAYNQVHLRGEVADRPYFDLVPMRQKNGRDRIAFLRVSIWVQRDDEHRRGEHRVINPQAHHAVLKALTSLRENRPLGRKTRISSRTTIETTSL